MTWCLSPNDRFNYVGPYNYSECLDDGRAIAIAIVIGYLDNGAILAYNKHVNILINFLSSVPQPVTSFYIQNVCAANTGPYLDTRYDERAWCAVVCRSPLLSYLTPNMLTWSTQPSTSPSVASSIETPG